LSRGQHGGSPTVVDLSFLDRTKERSRSLKLESMKRYFVVTCYSIFGINFSINVEVFTVATMKNSVSWEARPCSSCKNQRYGGTYRLYLQGEKNQRDRNTLAISSVANYC
jgi:hypothetical protein